MQGKSISWPCKGPTSKSLIKEKEDGESEVVTLGRYGRREIGAFYTLVHLDHLHPLSMRKE